MGTLLDTTAFIDLERAVRRLPPATAMAEVSGRLQEQLGPHEEVGIAAITASELLHGVHRASAEHRARREAFVEAVLAAFPPLPFGLLAGRGHARIRTGLAAAGQDVGALDRLVAATAITARWRVGTANTRHFERIEGLDILVISFAGVTAARRWRRVKRFTRHLRSAPPVAHTATLSAAWRMCAAAPVAPSSITTCAFG